MASPRHGQPVAGPPVALPPSPVPPPLPAGYGCLAVDINRGIDRLPVGVRAWLRVDRHKVPAALRPGCWYVPVIVGRHRVKVADVTGVPLASTDLTVQERVIHPLRFDFGRWRYRVLDGAGNDVTRFGLWSQYSFLVLVFTGTAMLSGCAYVVFRVLPGLAS